MAALVAQGCAEIRWLAEKMGAKPATVSGLSGLGDIMLTCYGSLSRNRYINPLLQRCISPLAWQTRSGRPKVKQTYHMRHVALQISWGEAWPGRGVGGHLGQQQPGCRRCLHGRRGGQLSAHIQSLTARSHCCSSGWLLLIHLVSLDADECYYQNPSP